MPLDAKLYGLGGQSARYHNVDHILGSQFAIILNFPVYPVIIIFFKYAYLLSTITSSDENGVGSFGHFQEKTKTEWKYGVET